MTLNTRSPLLVLTLMGLWACSTATEVEVAPEADETLDIGEEVPELGKSVFGPVEMGSSKEDSIRARKGLPVSVDQANTAVWAVRNDWADTDTTEARRAGMAWAANSGLSWDEKYSAWVQGMRKVPSESYGDTFEMTTPYGKTLPAPAIECAETALFLRATFASWYALPFFIEAGGRSNRVLLGHFGFRTPTGKYRNTPNFKTAYADHSELSSRWQTEGWPTDSRLRGRKLGGSQDDYQPALFEGARAGAYFDELFLNKRTGYFMIYLLSYFGSVNVADPANLFNLDPRAIRAGDPLVERWQRTGIGHVLVVKHVERLDDRLAAELVSGSMPRRQPKWESANASMSTFTSDYCGGQGDSYGGEAYAVLGGGIKRWRTPINRNGYWTNIVPTADLANFVDAADREAIAARPGIFDQILGEISPEDLRTTMLEQIETKRMHLRSYPASCSARIGREEAFETLYDLESEHFGRSRSQVDAEFRTLEDYVLARLVYEESRTCCWNSSTEAMYEIIMQKASADVEDHTAQLCKAPTVFKVTDGGYQAFSDYAAEIGRADEWVAWSADESCPPAETDNDVLASQGWTEWCAVGESIMGGGEVPSNDDGFEPNDVAGEAAALPMGLTEGLRLCDGVDDWFKVEVAEGGAMQIDVRFVHGDGDIDVTLERAGDRIANAAGTSDVEQMSATVTAGTYLLRVARYGTAAVTCQPYSVKFTVETATVEEADDDEYEANDSREAAAALGLGEHEGLKLCDGVDDWFAFEVPEGGVAFDLTFSHADGDLDVGLFNDAGEEIASAASSDDNEQIEADLSAGRYTVRIYRYGNSALTCQPYSLSASIR